MSAEATEVQAAPADAPAEPTALQNVNTAVEKFDRVAAGLADLKAKYDGVLYEVTTTKGMKEACDARLAIRKPRYEVERVRKECKAPILALGKDIDARAAQIEGALLALEEPIDKQIKAEEARKADEKKRKEEAEAKRVRDIQGRLNHIRGFLVTYARQPAASIMEGIKALVEIATPLDTAVFQEYSDQAAQLCIDVLAKLREMHTAQLAHEAEQARLTLEREELTRKAAEQEEANRKERERIAADEAEAKRKAEAAEAERLRNIEAQMAQLKAEREQRQREDAERAERQRLEDEARAEENRQAQAALQRQQAELDAQRAEVERQQAELARPAPAPLESNTQHTGDFVVVADLVEIPADGDVYEPTEATEPGAGALVIKGGCSLTDGPVHFQGVIKEPRRFPLEDAEHFLAEAQRLLGIPVIFTGFELQLLAASPEALQVIIDGHDWDSSGAEACGAGNVVQAHDERIAELTALAQQLIKQREME